MYFSWSLLLARPSVCAFVPYFCRASVVSTCSVRHPCGLLHPLFCVFLVLLFMLPSSCMVVVLCCVFADCEPRSVAASRFSVCWSDGRYLRRRACAPGAGARGALLVGCWYVGDVCLFFSLRLHRGMCSYMFIYPRCALFRSCILPPPRLPSSSLLVVVPLVSIVLLGSVVLSLSLSGRL